MAKKKKKKVPVKSGRRRIALIDIEIVVYKVCMEQLVEQRESCGTWTWWLSEDNAVEEISNRIAEYKLRTKSQSVLLAIGGKANWRKRLEPTYKANREGQKKPLGYWGVVDRLRKEYSFIEFPWLEADDAIGIEHTRRRADETVVVSNDKDMRTLPGMLYDFGAEVPTIEIISPLDADRNHIAQALTGDPTDGYKGCKGVGKVGALRILDVCKNAAEMWDKAIHAFNEAGHTAQYALLQAQLARIVRATDYDRKTGELRLWTPKLTAKRRR